MIEVNTNPQEVNIQVQSTDIAITNDSSSLVVNASVESTDIILEPKNVELVTDITNLDLIQEVNEVDIVTNIISLDIVEHPVFIPFTTITDGVTTLNGISSIKFTGATVNRLNDNTGEVVIIPGDGEGGGGGSIDSINTIEPLIWNIQDKSLLLSYNDDFEIRGSQLALYKPPTLTLTPLVTTLEIGAVLSNLSLSWVLNKLALRVFTQGPLSNLSLGEGGSGTYNHTGANLTNDTIYTLSASDSRSTVQASSQVRFTFRRYWGTSSELILSNEIILGFNSELAFNRSKSWSQNGEGKYLYYCYPANWGLSTFLVNGLLNTAWSFMTQTHINQYGVSEIYNIYKSNDIQFGDSILIESK